MGVVLSYFNNFKNLISLLTAKKQRKKYVTAEIKACLATGNTRLFAIEKIAGEREIEIDWGGGYLRGRLSQKKYYKENQEAQEFEGFRLA